MIINMSESIKKCPYCGEEISINAKKCIHCKEWIEEPLTQESQSGKSRLNIIGIIGLTLALGSIVFSINIGANLAVWLMWGLGLLLSLIGLSKIHRWIAIAGFIISCIQLVLLMIQVFS